MNTLNLRKIIFLIICSSFILDSFSQAINYNEDIDLIENNIELFSFPNSVNNYDDCIYVRLRTKCGRTVFPLGGEVCVIASTNTEDWISFSPTTCHKNYNSVLQAYLPYYDGIRWESIENPRTRQSWAQLYETTQKANDSYGITGIYYKGEKEFKFNLSEPGHQRIRYFVNGGYFKYVNGKPTAGYYARPNSRGAEVFLDIVVVDINRVYNINDRTSLQERDKSGAGTFNIKGVTFTSLDNMNITAYKSIVIQSGTTIKNGSIVKMKIENTAFDKNVTCNSVSMWSNSTMQNPIILEEVQGEDAYNLTIGDENLVEVNYSNNVKSVTVTSDLDNEIKNISVYGIMGKMVINKSVGKVNSYSLDLSSLQPGIYVIQTYTDQGFSSKKISINR